MATISRRPPHSLPRTAQSLEGYGVSGQPTEERPRPQHLWQGRGRHCSSREKPGSGDSLALCRLTLTLTQGAPEEGTPLPCPTWAARFALMPSSTAVGAAVGKVQPGREPLPETSTLLLSCLATGHHSPGQHSPQPQRGTVLGDRVHGHSVAQSWVMSCHRVAAADLWKPPLIPHLITPPARRRERWETWPLWCR